MNSSEVKMGEDCCLKFEGDDTLSVRDGESLPRDAEALKAGSPHSFVFDRVFGQHSTQQEVFEGIGGELVQSVIDGFNGTVFVYGQTSSGKTFTMQGPDISDDGLKGFIPRAIDRVFYHIENSFMTVEWLLKVSIYEIYMERIRDLLDVDRKDLKIREDNLKGVYVQGLSEFFVSSPKEINSLLASANRNRIVASTKMNEASSRSHLLFQLEVYQKDTETMSAKTGKFILVDLAGSEKIAKTAAQGKTLEEAKKINLSLSALGNVINALTDPLSKHIPYRSSTLTRILQDSLGGNSLTSLIVTCSPSAYNVHETISTLRFGQRAKKIQNTPKVNKEFTVQELVLLLEVKEVEFLKAKQRIEYLEGVLTHHGIHFEANFEKEQEQEAFVRNSLGVSAPNKHEVSEQSTQTEQEMANIPWTDIQEPATVTESKTNLNSLAGGAGEPSIQEASELEEQLACREKELAAQVDLNHGLQADLQMLKADIEEDEKEISMLQQLLASQQARYKTDISDLQQSLEAVNNEMLKLRELAVPCVLTEAAIAGLSITTTNNLGKLPARKTDPSMLSSKGDAADIHIMGAASSPLLQEAIGSLDLQKQARYINTQPILGYNPEDSNSSANKLDIPENLGPNIASAQAAADLPVIDPANQSPQQQSARLSSGPAELEGTEISTARDHTSKFSSYFLKPGSLQSCNQKEANTCNSIPSQRLFTSTQLALLEEQLGRAAERVEQYHKQCAMLSTMLKQEGGKLSQRQLSSMLRLHEESVRVEVSKPLQDVSNLPKLRGKLIEAEPWGFKKNIPSSEIKPEIGHLLTDARQPVSPRSVIHSYLGRNPRIRMHLRSDLFAKRLAETVDKLGSKKVPTATSDSQISEVQCMKLESANQEGLVGSQMVKPAATSNISMLEVLNALYLKRRGLITSPRPVPANLSSCSEADSAKYYK